MKPSTLRFLCCPECQGGLALGDAESSKVVLDDVLVCEGCQRAYPVSDGIPRLVPADLSTIQDRTAQAFGWQWRHFREMHPEYEEQFLDWIHPFRPDFFSGRTILDAGCGTGRHTQFAAKYGAREVVAFDLSGAVDVAQEVAGDLPNVHVVQGDIYRPPFRSRAGSESFDFIYSIGVLDHLPDPRAGFEKLVSLLRPGGTIFVWVYAKEGTELLRRTVEPLRARVTSKLRPSTLRLVAWPLAVAFHGVAKIFYRPLRQTPVFRFLPMHEYLYSVSRFTFRQNYGIMFDQLVSPVVSYISGDELRRWFERAGLTDVQLSWRNRNSWRAHGIRPLESPSHE